MNENIAKALVAAQAEMPVVPMNATNPFLKNRYADLGSIIQTVRPILSKNGLAFSQLAISKDGEVGVKTILIHTTGEFIEGTITMPISAEKGLKTAQVAGSIITYLRRYSLSAILGIYADEDTDGNGGLPATTKKAAPKQKVTTLPSDQEFYATIASSDDPPVLYKDMEMEDLVHRFNGLEKYLKKTDLEQSTRDSAEMKRDAAKFYIDQKKGN